MQHPTLMRHAHGEDSLEKGNDPFSSLEKGQLRTSEFIRNVERKEWIERAHKSEASLRIDEVLASRKLLGNIRRLKDEMFQEIYDKMGDEMLPQDMKRALVVKTERYHPVVVALLCAITLGIFLCFRPRDDEAIIVLTKRERVLMYKVERVSFFHRNFYVVWQMLRNTIIVFLLVGLLPQLIVMALGAEALQFEQVNLEDAQKWIEDEIIEKITHNMFLQILVVTVVSFWFLFWCWTKLPHDYGDRHRQSHAAGKICASQWSLTGGNLFRSAQLRLFFGRFPDQGALDSGMRLNGAAAVAPVPKDELSRTFSLNPFAGKSSAGLMVIALLMLYVFITVDAVMTYGYAPSLWVGEIKEMEKFCGDASFDSVDKCTLSECEAWANEHYESRGFENFCRHVHFYNDPSNVADVWECGLYGKQAPCCGGCRFGGWQEIANTKSLEIFGMCVSLITDTLTVLVSFAAATAVFAWNDEKDHVDIKFARRINYLRQVSNFGLTQPLAVDFLFTMFDSAFQGRKGRQEVNITPGRAEAYRQGAHKTSSSCTTAGNDCSSGMPELRRMRRYDNLTVESEEDANFQDVTNFEMDEDAHDWEQFFRRDGKSLIKKGESRWVPKVVIPRHCLGISQDEHILAAWVEKPHLTLLLVSPYLLASLVIWVLLLAAPDEIQGYVKLWFFGDSHFDKILSASLNAGGLLLLCLVAVYAYLSVAVKHVVILTDMRVLYARVVDKCVLCALWSPQLRIDCFRHDHDATYGSMVTSPLTLYMRLTRAPWTPGSVMLQPGFYGLLRFRRNYGNALNVYQMVCQLTKLADPVLGEQEIKEAGVCWDVAKRYVDDNMERVLGDVWRIKHMQPDDILSQTPNLYLTGDKEKPIFYWSFKEFGWLSSPVNVNTDVVITTNRVYLYKRAIYKQFDSKTCCCFATCWCTWLRRLTQGRKGLRRSSSFVTLPYLLSFATEVNIAPPVWYDPIRWPIKCPCFDTCCEWCTMCCTCRLCKGEKVECNTTTCSCLPSRAGPRAQLWVMWRHRYNVVQPDLIAKVRPYNLQDPTLVADCLYHCGCGRESVEIENTPEGEVPDYEKIEMLRRVMGVIQDLSAFEQPCTGL